MDISELNETFKELGQILAVLQRQVNEKMSPAITFPTGHVPVKVVARYLGESESWVRSGIIAGWLPIGTATRNGKEIMDVQEMDSKKGMIKYHISPKLLYEQTGYLWKGEKI